MLVPALLAAACFNEKTQQQKSFCFIIFNHYLMVLFYFSPKDKDDKKEQVQTKTNKTKKVAETQLPVNQ